VRVFEAMVGPDPLDNHTLAQLNLTLPANYTQFLTSGGLAGARVGVLRQISELPGADGEVSALFQAALGALGQAGATLVDFRIAGNLLGSDWDADRGGEGPAIGEAAGLRLMAGDQLRLASGQLDDRAAIPRALLRRPLERGGAVGGPVGLPVALQGRPGRVPGGRQRQQPPPQPGGTVWVSPPPRWAGRSALIAVGGERHRAAPAGVQA
jgi:hypothetical protein